MTATSEGFIRPPARPGPARWLKKNLFSTWFNTLLTIVSASVIAVVVYGLIRWIFFLANWSPVVENLRLYAVGPYPQEQMWRIWTIVYMVSFLTGVSAGKWRGTVLTFARVMGIAYLVLAVLPISLEYLAVDTRLRLAANGVVIALGYAVGARLRLKGIWLALAWGPTSYVRQSDSEP